MKYMSEAEMYQAISDVAQKNKQPVTMLELKTIEPLCKRGNRFYELYARDEKDRTKRVFMVSKQSERFSNADMIARYTMGAGATYSDLKELDNPYTQCEFYNCYICPTSKDDIAAAVREV